MQPERAALALIRELCAAGSSIRQIVAALTTEGHRPKRGGRWHPETVRRVLARDPARRPVMRPAS